MVSSGKLEGTVTLPSGPLIAFDGYRSIQGYTYRNAIRKLAISFDGLYNNYANRLDPVKTRLDSFSHRQKTLYNYILNKIDLKGLKFGQKEYTLGALSAELKRDLFDSKLLGLRHDIEEQFLDQNTYITLDFTTEVNGRSFSIRIPKQELVDIGYTPAGNLLTSSKEADNIRNAKTEKLRINIAEHLEDIIWKHSNGKTLIFPILRINSEYGYQVITPTSSTTKKEELWWLPESGFFEYKSMNKQDRFILDHIASLLAHDACGFVVMKWEDLNSYSGTTVSERVNNYLDSNHEMVCAITRDKFIGNGEIFSELPSGGKDSLIDGFENHPITITGYSTAFREYFNRQQKKWSSHWNDYLFLSRDCLAKYFKDIEEGKDARSAFLKSLLRVPN
jgi:hypothetical protein